tara:strand:- start:1835 stop:2419 length:585 start_codon:yes stop_codon:yes gene_type:complete
MRTGVLLVGIAFVACGKGDAKEDPKCRDALGRVSGELDDCRSAKMAESEVISAGSDAFDLGKDFPKIDSVCALWESDDDNFFFHVPIKIKYTKHKGQNPKAHGHELWYLWCDGKTKACHGYFVDLLRISKEDTISYHDIGRIDNAKIVSRTASTAVVEWPVMRTFTLDMNKREVAYVESADRIEGRGVGHCGPE